MQKLTGVYKKRLVTFETGAGVITASCEGELVTVNLTKPKDLCLDQKVALSIGTQAIHSLTVGNPHAVVFVPDADQAMVQELGREIRNHPHFAPSEQPTSILSSASAPAASASAPTNAASKAKRWLAARA